VRAVRKIKNFIPRSGSATPFVCHFSPCGDVKTVRSCADGPVNRKITSTVISCFRATLRFRVSSDISRRRLVVFSHVPRTGPAFVIRRLCTLSSILETVWRHESLRGGFVHTGRVFRVRVCVLPAGISARKLLQGIGSNVHGKPTHINNCNYSTYVIGASGTVAVRRDLCRRNGGETDSSWFT